MVATADLKVGGVLLVFGFWVKITCKFFGLVGADGGRVGGTKGFESLMIHVIRNDDKDDIKREEFHRCYTHNASNGHECPPNK